MKRKIAPDRTAGAQERKPTTPAYVYCYQLGETSWFKIGRSIEPVEREKAFLTSQPLNLNMRRRELTVHPDALEAYIHRLLELRRVKNRKELFDTTMEEINEAFATAIPIVNEMEQVKAEATALGKKRPANETMLHASDEVLRFYEELRDLSRNEFLIQQRMKFLEGKIKLATGDSLGIIDVFKWDWRARQQIKLAALRTARPKLYEFLMRRFGSSSGSRYCDWA